MLLEEVNETLFMVIEAITDAPIPATMVGTQARDANDVDMWGLDARARKRLRVKNKFSKRGVRRPRIPNRTNLPFNLAYI